MRLLATIIVSMGVLSSAIAGGPIAGTVSNISFKILPERDIRATSYSDYAITNLYSQGAIVNFNGRMYMTMSNGVSGTAGPTHGYGLAVDTSGAMLWYRVPSGKRNGAVISSVSTNVCWFSFSTPAVVDRGPFLVGSGSSLSIPKDFQGAVFCISPAAATENTITASEY